MATGIRSREGLPHRLSRQPGNLPPTSSFRVPGKHAVRKTVAATAGFRSQRFAAVLHRRLLLVLPLLSAGLGAEPLPKVASINLCADQLLLELADEEQVATVSWLAADPQESLLADRAQAFPLNYGTAEEILRHDPDVVLAGRYTNTFTRSLLEKLGYRIVTLEPANDLDEIADNLRTVAAAIGQSARGEARIATMYAEARSIEAAANGRRVPAIVIRPGGYTVGAGSLADTLMTLAGLDNVAANGGLDRWGSLSIEALLLSGTELLIFADYRRDESSLANELLEHPVLRDLRARTAATEIEARYWACGTPRSLLSAALLAKAAGHGGRLQ
jgi:iron complex transport system substrate-binding protein